MLQLRRLTDTATILTATQGARDDHGNKPLTWTVSATEPCLFQQQGSSEAIDQRDAVVTRGVLFGIPDTTLTAFSRIQLASVPGVTWRVVGDPDGEVALGGKTSHTESVIEKVTS